MARLKQIIVALKDYNPATAIGLTVGGFFIAQVVGAIAYVAYASIRGWSLEQMSTTVGSSIPMALAFSIIVYGFYLLLIRWFLKLNGKSFKDIGLKMTKAKWEVFAYAFAGYGAYFITLIISTVIIGKLLPTINLEQKQELGFDTYTTGWGLVAIFIALVIVPPIVEEIVTRGFLYTGLRKKLSFFWTGLIVAIIFGAAHLQWGSDAPLLWAAAIDTFILSWILVYIREKSGSLYPAIGLHMIKNGMAFLALFIFHVA